MNLSTLYRIIFFLFIGLLVYSCAEAPTKRIPTANCGIIVKKWSQQYSGAQGNPCGENTDYSRRFAIIVKNDITGNEKCFCVNIDVYIRFENVLGGVYCDDDTRDGW